jgi:hypothetical protein
MAGVSGIGVDAFRNGGEGARFRSTVKRLAQFSHKYPRRPSFSAVFPRNYFTLSSIPAILAKKLGLDSGELIPRTSPVYDEAERHRPWVANAEAARFKCG